MECFSIHSMAHKPVSESLVPPKSSPGSEARTCCERRAVPLFDTPNKPPPG